MFRLSLWSALFLLRISQGGAWVPTPSNAPACIRTACLGATLALSNAAYAADIPIREVAMDTNVPSILQTVHGNRKTIVSSLRQVTGPSGALEQVYSPNRRSLNDLYSPVQTSIGNQQTLLSSTQDLTGTATSVSVALPSDNPAVGSTILPQDNFLTYTIQSPLLSRLPLLESTSAVLVAATQTSFWDLPFVFQPLPLYEFSNKNVIGGTAFALGSIYAVSYSYYQNSVAGEEAEAQRKREAMAAKQKQQQVDAKKVKQDKEPTTTVDDAKEEDLSTEKEVLVAAAVAVPAMSRDEELAVEKARAAVEKAKREDASTARLERNRHVQVELEEEDYDTNVEEEEIVEERVSKRKKSLWKFWRWMKRDYNVES